MEGEPDEAGSEHAGPVELEERLPFVALRGGRAAAGGVRLYFRSILVETEWRGGLTWAIQSPKE